MKNVLLLASVASMIQQFNMKMCIRDSNNAYVATEQPGLTDLLTYHGFSIRITGKAGIRFKTGISTDLRAQLLGNGVNGYHLKEYLSLIHI